MSRSHLKFFPQFYYFICNFFRLWLNNFWNNFKRKNLQGTIVELLFSHLTLITLLVFILSSVSCRKTCLRAGTAQLPPTTIGFSDSIITKIKKKKEKKNYKKTLFFVFFLSYFGSFKLTAKQNFLLALTLTCTLAIKLAAAGPTYSSAGRKNQPIRIFVPNLVNLFIYLFFGLI